MPNSKFKLHRTRKFYRTYELQYTHCFFWAKTALVVLCYVMLGGFAPYLAKSVHDLTGTKPYSFRLSWKLRLQDTASLSRCSSRTIRHGKFTWIRAYPNMGCQTRDAILTHLLSLFWSYLYLGLLLTI